MPGAPGLRERKKLEQRQRIADAAALLFARRGYDAVSMGDVATAADVSYQTVYNYFPAKQDLGLDRAEAIRHRYDRLVRERAAGTSPAAALRPEVRADIDRYLACAPSEARGEHPALCVVSRSFRGHALLSRERDVTTIATAIGDTAPAVPRLVAHAHAAALVAVLQAVTDGIGRRVLADQVSDAAAEEMRRDAAAALDELDRQFLALLPTPVGATGGPAVPSPARAARPS